MNRWRRWSENPRVVLAACTALGAALRIANLTAKAVSDDEGQLFAMANGSLHHVLAINATLNSAPPLYPLLVSVALHLGGTSVAVFRLVSLLAGIAAIPLVYLLARQWLGAWPSVFAAALVACSPTQVEYSQQVRVYALVVCLAALMCWAAVRFVRAPSWNRAIGWGVVTAIALFTYYGLGIVALSLGLVSLATLLSGHSARRTWGMWLAAQGVGVLAAAFVVMLALQSQLALRGTGADFAPYLSSGLWDGSFGMLAHLAVTQTEDLLDFLYPSLLTVTIAVVGLISTFEKGNSKVLLGIVVLPFLFTFLGAILGYYPYVAMRQDLFLAPMYYLLAAAGMAFLAARTNGRVIPLTIAAVILVYGARYTVRYLLAPVETIRPVVQRLQRERRPEDATYVYSGVIYAYQYYARHDATPWVRGVSGNDNPARFVVQLDSVFASSSRVWIILSRSTPVAKETLLRYAASRRTVTLVDSLAEASLYLAK